MARSVTPAQHEDEDALHIAVADFMRLAWPADLEWLHVPNGGKREKVTRTRADGSTYEFSPEAKKLKRMGVRPGAYDLWVQLPRGQYGWIELKTRSGQLSDDQIDFGQRIAAHGGGRVVCRSVEEVQAVLTKWLALFDRKLRASVGPLFAGRAA